MSFQSRRSFLRNLAAASITSVLAQNLDGLPAKAVSIPDEDGYRAWLRYDAVKNVGLREKYSSQIKSFRIECTSPTANIISAELTTALSGLLDKTITETSDESDSPGILVCTNKSPSGQKLLKPKDFESLGNEGFLLRSIQRAKQTIIVIAAQTDVACLYGIFALLRLIQTEHTLDDLSLKSTPTNALRILAHSDNLDGSIDRGYQGKSLWRWSDLPEKVNSRLTDYARLNASIGLNGVVLNAVNADATILSLENIIKFAALASKFRPYGIKIYVCANFSAPKTLGGLPSADPFAQDVQNWWKQKADEIYKYVPDFGGFLVKANSEGVPGPLDYGRSHADGANMMAAALAPHGGIVMWRAFVYTKGNEDPDRVKRSYLEFKPLDGKFDRNVLVQIKNGPLDFQPREPFHPLFGAMPATRLIGELQINQEYLGQSTHLVYLASQWHEFLSSNTFSNGQNITVAKIVETSGESAGGGFSATSNVGDDKNWCGHHLLPINWFAYGRLCWNPELLPVKIADDWIKMTWSSQPVVVKTISEILLASYEAYVNYTMPLGLHHLVGGDHYAPLPEGESDPRGIFHHAALDGIGYDRTRTTGSDAVDQYHRPLNTQFNELDSCPEKFLLWFHHVSWHHHMSSGRTLWGELCFKYHDGAKTAQKMKQDWASLQGFIDDRRHSEVATKFEKQAADSIVWSNHCLNYFGQYSKLPIT